MSSEPIWTIKGSGNPISCLQVNKYGDQVCYANTHRQLVLASAFTGETVLTFNQSTSSYGFVGCRYHPCDQRKLIATTRDGFILVFDSGPDPGFQGEPRPDFMFEPVQSGRHLGCNLICLDVDPYGDTFALGAADGTVRVHNLDTLQRINALIRGPSYASNQSAVVTAVEYHPEDGHIILSASTNRVYVWDIRSGSCERSLFGPHIRGAGIALHQNSIYTASFREQKQIEVWDYASMKKVRDIAFDRPGAKPAQLTTVCVARNGIVLAAAGGVGVPGQAFDAVSGLGVGTTDPCKAPVCISTMSPFGSSVLFGTEAGTIQCHPIRLRPPNPEAVMRSGLDL